MQRRLVHQTVADLEELRASSRHRLATISTPLVAFGIVNLGGVVATLVVGQYHLALYGIPAFAGAVWFSSRAFAARARVEGIQIALRPVVLTAVVFCTTGVILSRAGYLLGMETLSSLGPFLGQAIGLWLLGRWASSDALLGASVIMVSGSAVIGAFTSGDAAVALQFGLYGIALLASAAYVHQRGTSS
jgi:hypothetical protein